ncbi:hypothetical protein [Cohnella sp. 56]|uniref:hypothetical protein n=1 Tax=Cohnella sp. 56 TaxID=3113722 RepID=UPI0030E8468D
MAIRKRATTQPMKTGRTPNRKLGVPSRPLLLIGAGAGCGRCSRPGRSVNCGTAAVVSALRLSARAMLPFYRTVATDRAFARRWSDNVVGLRLDGMKRQLKHAAPLAARLQKGIGTNGIGYFIDYPAPGTADVFATGVTIPPGTLQFYFSSAAHGAVAADLLPFCRALAANHAYAAALVAAMDAADARAAEALVRSRVRSGALRTVDAAPDYLALDFKPAGSRYIYRSLFFREGV